MYSKTDFFRSTHHRECTSHWATVRAECAAILVQHSSSILATSHTHALQLVGMVTDGDGSWVQRVVRSRLGVVGEMMGEHVVWQVWGCDRGDVEVIVAQTA